MVERHGTYRDYEWVITFELDGHRCGYVGIPENHPFFEKPDDFFNFISCHGGITFTGHEKLGFSSDDWLVGFDCAHFPMDAIDLECIKRYFGDKELKSIEGSIGRGYRTSGHIWTAEEVEEELKSMIDQIIKHTPDAYEQFSNKLDNIEKDLMSGKYKEG